MRLKILKTFLKKIEYSGNQVGFEILLLVKKKLDSQIFIVVEKRIRFQKLSNLIMRINSIKSYKSYKS